MTVSCFILRQTPETNNPTGWNETPFVVDFARHFIVMQGSEANDCPNAKAKASCLCVGAIIKATRCVSLLHLAPCLILKLRPHPNRNQSPHAYSWGQIIPFPGALGSMQCDQKPVGNRRVVFDLFRSILLLQVLKRVQVCNAISWPQFINPACRCNCRAVI